MYQLLSWRSLAPYSRWPAGVVEKLDMRPILAFGLLALLLGQTGCIVLAEGQSTARSGESSLLKLCGKQPSGQVVERLVRTECGGISNFRLRCSKPRARRVTGTARVPIHGWHVTAELTIGPGKDGASKVQFETRDYMIHKRKLGFAIIAHATGYQSAADDKQLHKQLKWQPRNITAIDNQLALIHRHREMQHQLDRQRWQIEKQKRMIAKQRKRELQREFLETFEEKRQELRRQGEERRERERTERRREWEIMTKRPTAE